MSVDRNEERTPGDTFMGAFIEGVIEAGLAGADRRADLRGIDHSALEAILRRCATAAGVTVSRTGADPPWREDLTSHLSPRSAPTAAAKG